MVSSIIVAAIIGITALLGYIGNAIFHKTRVPDVLWLIIFGIVISQLNLAPSADFLPFTFILTDIAIVVLSFDLGLHANMRKIQGILPRTLLLSILTFAFSAIAVALISYVLLNIPLINALILGAILGSISAETIETIIHHTRSREDVKHYLMYESLITDGFSVVVAVFLMGVTALSFSVFSQIGLFFLFALAAGLVSGLVWLIIFDRVKGRPFDYIVTLGIAFLVFASVEQFTGLGAISVLLFGLIMGNGKRLRKLLRLVRAEKEEYSISPFMKKFNSEVSFFLRGFYFVLLGILAGVYISDISLVWAGIAIAVALIVVRMPAVEIAMLKKNLPKPDINLMKFLLPRDISAVVLVFLALTRGIPGAETLVNIVFVVVLVTVLFTTAATIMMTRKSLPEEKKYKEFGGGRYEYAGWDNNSE